MTSFASVFPLPIEDESEATFVSLDSPEAEEVAPERSERLEAFASADFLVRQLVRALDATGDELTARGELLEAGGPD